MPCGRAGGALFAPPLRPNARWLANARRAPRKGDNRCILSTAIRMIIETFRGAKAVEPCLSAGAVTGGAPAMAAGAGVRLLGGLFLFGRLLLPLHRPRSPSRFPFPLPPCPPLPRLCCLPCLRCCAPPRSGRCALRRWCALGSFRVGGLGLGRWGCSGSCWCRLAVGGLSLPPACLKSRAGLLPWCSVLPLG